MAGVEALSNAEHLLVLREERRDKQKNRDDVNGAKIKDLIRDLDTTNQSLILHAKCTGSWVNVHSNMVTGTVLADIDSCDLL